MTIIDAHSHLWLKQDTYVDGQRIYPLEDGRAMFFGEERQMVPPFMTDGTNKAETFLSNMNYAQVGAAVVVQEVIDGNQNEYLAEVMERYPDRFFCCGMPELGLGMEPGQDKEALSHLLSPDGIRNQIHELHSKGFRGIAIPGHRIHQKIEELIPAFKYMEENGMILSMCLDDNPVQIAQMKEAIEECPELKVAIGHFGMVTQKHWMEQIRLAEAKNVMIESGGITWLFNSEFYPFPSAVKAIMQAADEVGMEKLMWGSDYPRTITAITYRMSYDFVLKSKDLTEKDKALFLGENAARFYGFRNLPELPYIKNMSE